jgi:hypothetical protein
VDQLGVPEALIPRHHLHVPVALSLARQHVATRNGLQQLGACLRQLYDLDVLDLHLVQLGLEDAHRTQHVFLVVQLQRLALVLFGQADLVAHLLDLALVLELLVN